jgi:hypothetical protein
MAQASGRRPSMSDWLFGLALLTALAVHAPALFAPYTIDDFAQRDMTHGIYPPGDRGPFALYDFVDDTNRQELVNRGVLPWWTHPRLVVRFFRPLSSLSLYLDYQFAPTGVVWGHAQNMLWWAGSSALVYLLMARLFNRRVARIACVIFAASPCHVIPLVWVANREVFISQVLGMAGLLAYVRWRRAASVRHAAMSLAFFTVAMAAGEYSICFAGYVAAFELVGTRDRLVRRAVGLLPFALPAAGYLLLRAAYHYGVRSGGLYFDPFWDFPGFIQGALRRFTVLLCTGWVGSDDVRLVGQPWFVIAITMAVAAPLLAAAMVRTFRVMPASFRLDAAWLLLGSVLSIIPVLAVLASARLLGVPMVGIAAIVALVISEAWFPAQPPERRGLAELTAIVAVALAFIHFVDAPYHGFTNTRLANAVGNIMNSRIDWARHHTAGKSEVVVLRAETIGTVLFTPSTLGDMNLPWHVLSYEADHVLVLRTGERSLELVASPKPIFKMDPGEVFRPLDGTLHAGDSVQVPGIKATVLQLDKDGMPRRARFDFDRNLDDPSILWIKETMAGFEEDPPPQKGQGEPITP